jgi:hypothetical protein
MCKRKTAELFYVVLLRAHVGKLFLVALDAIRDRSGARMAAQHEVDLREGVGDLPQGPAKEFAVVGIEDGAAAAGEQHGAVDAQKIELVGVQSEILAQLHGRCRAAPR